MRGGRKSREGSEQHIPLKSKMTEITVLISQISQSHYPPINEEAPVLPIS